MEVRLVQCKSATSPSRLPGLDRALNPYRGCGHACSYCYAQDVTRFEMGRPWGDVIEVKVNIVSCLKKELSKGPKGIYGIGTVTDPYQPPEKEYELTRGCLRLLREAGAQASILTKSDLILRDLDLLQGWKDLEVGISIGCADDRVASIVERCAPSPTRRFDAASRLVGAGIDTYLMAAPILPGLCDSESSLQTLVEKCADSGVRRIMWDKYNQKPLASRRLRLSLQSAGLEMQSSQGRADEERIRAILRDECSKRGLQLVEAF